MPRVLLLVVVVRSRSDAFSQVVVACERLVQTGGRMHSVSIASSVGFTILLVAERLLSASGVHHVVSRVVFLCLLMR